MDSEQDISAEGAPGVAYDGVGARLRTAREARRLDLAHIASETRIPLRHLEAIEEGDFASLPSRTYAIGFTRTYAKAVGLDDAAIIDAVRAELADGSGHRAAAGSGGIEPGDPAKLPSAGLAWFGAFAALLLAAGLIAYFSTRFGAGIGPAPLAAPPKPSPSVAAAPAAAAPAPAASGPVVITATADVWLRIADAGGVRLIEKELKAGESFTVPATATDPRINTGRPDLLAITIGGQAVPALATTPTQISGVPVSAAALLARGQVQAPAAAATGAALATPPRANQRRTARPAAASTGEGAAAPASAPAAPAEAPAPAPASDAGASPPTG